MKAISIILLLAFISYATSQTASPSVSSSNKPPGEIGVGTNATLFKGYHDVCSDLRTNGNGNAIVKFITGGQYRGTLNFTSCTRPITLISEVYGLGGSGGKVNFTGGGGGAYILTNITFNIGEVVTFSNFVAANSTQNSVVNLTRPAAGYKHFQNAGNGQDGQATYGGFGGNASYSEIPTSGSAAPVTVSVNGGIGGGYSNGTNTYGIATGGNANLATNFTSGLQADIAFLVGGGAGGISRGGGTYRSIGGPSVTSSGVRAGGGGAAYLTAGGIGAGAPGLQAGNLFGPAFGGGGNAVGSGGQIVWTFAGIR